MAKKNCELCENGTMPVAITLEYEEEPQWAEYCPWCGRCLKEV